MSPLSDVWLSLSPLRAVTTDGREYHQKRMVSAPRRGSLSNRGYVYPWQVDKFFHVYPIEKPTPFLGG